LPFFEFRIKVVEATEVTTKESLRKTPVDYVCRRLFCQVHWRWRGHPSQNAVAGAHQKLLGDLRVRIVEILDKPALEKGNVARDRLIVIELLLQ
jgi:hypothetical protein